VNKDDQELYLVVVMYHISFSNYLFEFKIFGQVIMRYHLLNPSDQISGWTTHFLFCQIDFISGLSQSLGRILSNSKK
jgi:hypothetical protein